MKTRKAFALKDFDEEKILQRPYFKKFNLPNASDAEILEMLQATGDDTISEMEQKLNQIKSLFNRVIKFHEFIWRHIGRLDKFAIYQAVKYKKVNVSTIEYHTADWSVSNLAGILQGNFYNLEKKIQARYRKQFTANLRKFLKASGLNQKQLGELIHISPQGMSHYAKGDRDMSIPTLARVVKILNISADKLLGIE